jgi:hypothetical protein
MLALTLVVGAIACGDQAEGSMGGGSAGAAAAATKTEAGTETATGVGGGAGVGGGVGTPGGGGAGSNVSLTLDGSAFGDSGGSAEAGTVSACGVSAGPTEPEPAVHPDPVTADTNAVTAINDGDVDQAATNVTAISAGAGMSPGMQGTSAVWKLEQPGAFLEYSLKVVTAGTYTVNAVYFAAADGGVGDVLLNGAKVGEVTFGTTAKLGGYGGIPNGLSRGPGTAMSLVSGINKVRLAFTARSAPVDVLGLQVNYSGRALPNAAKIQPLAAQTILQSDAPSDFYRIHYDPNVASWNCQRTFCLVEYLVETQKAGRYSVTMKYAGASNECSGVRFLVDGQPQADFQLPPGAGTSPSETIQLPCGVSRLSIRNANYLTGGAYCGYGAQYGQVELKLLP